MTNLSATAAQPSFDQQLRLDVAKGCPAKVDALAATAPAEHRFLRAAWYRAAGADACVTASRDGRLVAALPIVGAGPPMLGARAIAGMYWPFRNLLLDRAADDETVGELLRALRSGNALGPFWRLGPVHADDPTAVRLMKAAPCGGWTLLTRSLGETYRLDLDRFRAEQGDWPSRSSRKRIALYERRLARLGRVDMHNVSGKDCTPAIVDYHSPVEAASWVGALGSKGDSKFLRLPNRRFWERCVADPKLADMLSAVLVRVDGRPVAFSFDLTVGTLQYGIAGSYDSTFARLNVGKLANEWNLLRSAERGVKMFDWGAGDSGYKRETGFRAGPEILDCLFVRNAALARLLRPHWQQRRSAGFDEARKLPIGFRNTVVITSLTAAIAASAMAE